jgi:hypothetical protein
MGAFGEVYAADWNGRKVALKTFINEAKITDTDVQKCMDEVRF